MDEHNLYFRELVSAARDYCLLIEYIDTYQRNDWLADIARILPRIQMAMTHLDDRKLEYGFFTLPDLEERFELFCRLKDLLGEDDSYWLEHDKCDDKLDQTGSLADDFADIYFELKRGLSLYEADGNTSQDALIIWQTGYILHWGQHVVDAERHLFSLRTCSKSH
ncbi:MAG: DUF5063 domain-containing protein [Methylococcales bacterium]